MALPAGIPRISSEGGDGTGSEVSNRLSTSSDRSQLSSPQRHGGLVGMWQGYREHRRERKQRLQAGGPLAKDMEGRPPTGDLDSFLTAPAQPAKAEDLEQELQAIRAESTRHQTEMARQRLEIEALRSRLQQTEVDLEEASDELSRLQPPTFNGSRELWRFQQALEHNIAREMVVAKEGRHMAKIASRGSCEPRYVAISDTDMQLMWCKKPPLVQKSATILDLQTVQQIDFGHEALTAQRQRGTKHEVVPWNCFSLRTLERSYDFVCPDEDTSQCFVLAISRLLSDRAGAIPTRRKFIAQKAWCKVRDVCRREQMNMHQVFIRAMRQASGEDAEVHRSLTSSSQKEAVPFESQRSGGVLRSGLARMWTGLVGSPSGECSPALPASPASPAQPQPPSAEEEHTCGCGNTFMPDSNFCRKCGMKRPEPDEAKAKAAPKAKEVGAKQLQTYLQAIAALEAEGNVKSPKNSPRGCGEETTMLRARSKKNVRFSAQEAQVLAVVAQRSTGSAADGASPGSSPFSSPRSPGISPRGGSSPRLGGTSPRLGEGGPGSPGDSPRTSPRLGEGGPGSPGDSPRTSPRLGASAVSPRITRRQSVEQPAVVKKVSDKKFSAMQLYASGKKKWPKVGETWLLAEDVEKVTVYKDKECTVWANRLMSKRGPEQQAVRIVATEGGERVAEIMGVGKMKFVRGWIEIVDTQGVWAIKPSFDKNW